MKRIKLENGYYKEINNNGNIFYYNKYGKRHREDGTAIERLKDGWNLPEHSGIGDC